VAEAVRLHLVVAHLHHELGTDGRFFELPAAPAVGLREPALGRVLEQRQETPRDVVVACGRAQSAVFSGFTLTTPSREPAR
jgi:hypothetical protein